MLIELEETERDFITLTALNHYWNYCREELKRKNLEDIEKVNLQIDEAEAMRLMKKLDKTLSL